MPGYLERINKLKMAGKLESTPNTPSRGGDLVLQRRFIK